MKPDTKNIAQYSSSPGANEKSRSDEAGFSW